MFGRTYEQLKQAFANGEEKLKADEYLGEDGLPYCNICKTARFFVSDDKKFAMRAMCKCLGEKYVKEVKNREMKQKVEEFNVRQRLSLIGERYKDVGFKKALITDNNKKAYIKCKNYVANADKVLENNIGLYVYGDNSSGKTFLTACICNELIWKGYRCIYTNLASILNEIRSSYDGKGIGESELSERLRYYDFAFIDDFGKEFLGREFNTGSAKWAEGKLFEILNARYNSQRPTIFSSNYSISELASVLTLDKAIVERVNEMSTRVIKLEGDDFRKNERETKSDVAKSFGV